MSFLDRLYERLSYVGECMAATESEEDLIAYGQVYDIYLDLIKDEQEKTNELPKQRNRRSLPS